MPEQFVMDSPIGRLAVHTELDKLIQLDYGTRRRPDASLTDPLHKMIKQQILAYFANPVAGFRLPLAIQGTDFQKRVWQSLLQIPSGQILSYGELARYLQSSARAVGNACRANPIPLIVPCHRVTAKNGIGGFSGMTHGRSIERKRWLLRHEGVIQFT